MVPQFGTVSHSEGWFCAIAVTPFPQNYENVIHPPYLNSPINVVCHRFAMSQPKVAGPREHAVLAEGHLWGSQSTRILSRFPAGHGNGGESWGDEDNGDRCPSVVKACG